MAEVALGLDLGTSGVRVLAVTVTGETVAEVNRPYPLLTPKPAGRSKAALLAMRGVEQISDAVGIVETAAERTLEPRGFTPYKEAWTRYWG